MNADSQNVEIGPNGKIKPNIGASYVPTAVTKQRDKK